MRCFIDTTQLTQRSKQNAEIVDGNQNESILRLIHNFYVMTNISQTDAEHRLGLDRAQEQNRC